MPGVAGGDEKAVDLGAPVDDLIVVRGDLVEAGPPGPDATAERKRKSHRRNFGNAGEPMFQL